MTKIERRRDLYESEPSLYEKFGGEQSIKVLVDHWFQKSSCVYYQGKALELRKHKYIEYFKTLLGGQKYYIGKGLATAHQGLGISNAVFNDALSSLSASIIEMKH